MLIPSIGIYPPGVRAGGMGAVENTGETVESHLSVLGETYSSFPVNQTTLAVRSSRYEREVEHAESGCITVYTKVHNDSSEVLHVDEEDSLELPSTTTTVDELEPAAREAVKETVGIECTLTGLEQATIFGIRDADDFNSNELFQDWIVDCHG